MTQAASKPDAAPVSHQSEAGGGSRRIPDRARPESQETYTNATALVRLALQEHPDQDGALASAGLPGLVRPNGRIVVTTPLFRALFGDSTSQETLFAAAREIVGDIFHALLVRNFLPGLIVVAARKRKGEPFYYVISSAGGDAALITPMSERVGDILKRNSH